MGRIQNRVPIKVYPAGESGVAGRVRNRIPWLVEVVDSVDDADVINRIPLNVVEVAEYPDPIHNANPIRVYLDPDGGLESHLGNAEPVAVYVVSGSLAYCPTAVTTDENGVVSRLKIKVCFCDTVVPPEEGDLFDNVSLTVNGDSVSWTIPSVADWDFDKCVTFDVSAPLSYGDVIVFHYDHSGINPWPSMSVDVDINVSNIIGAYVPKLDFSNKRNSMYLGVI